VVLVGFFGQHVPLDLDLVINREQSMVAARGKRPTSFAQALELMADGRVDPARLITHRFKLGEWRAAFATAEQSGTKVVLEMYRQMY
jgi:threonine dehydrogenase-like Zn-dependent dehydrogenase